MRRPLILAALILVILAAPALAMRFTDEVAWGPADFLLAALLLGGAAVLFELTLRLVRRPLHRGLVVGVIGAGVLLVWAQGAVGVF